jgi:hypothetical protein
MKLLISGIALLFVAALAIPSAVEAQNWQRITTAEQFQTNVVGREIVTTEGNRFTSHADGRVTGQWAGQPMVGAWQWHQGFWCRNVRVGNNPETGTDCQLIELSGNQIRSTREQGRGTSGVGTIQ